MGDPTDLPKDYRLSIWSPTDPPDLPKFYHRPNRPSRRLSTWYMESHRPHRPSKISIWSSTDLPQTLQSYITDPTDLQKDYLLSIWSPTDPTDLPKLAYGVPQTSQHQHQHYHHH